MKMMSNGDEESSEQSSHQGESKRTSFELSSSVNVNAMTMRVETSRIRAVDCESSSSSSSSSSGVLNANNRIRTTMRQQQRKRTRPRIYGVATTAENEATAARAGSLCIGAGVSYWGVLFLLGMMVARHTGTQMNGTGSTLFVGAAALSGGRNTVHSSRILRSSAAAAATGIGSTGIHAKGTGGVTDEDDDDDEPPIMSNIFMERQAGISKNNHRSLQNNGGPEENDVESAPQSPPTRRPSPRPTTLQPTVRPTTLQPTVKPTDRPTANPTDRPTVRPTNRPTRSPTVKPTLGPTAPPTRQPTNRPTMQPTNMPTMQPTNRPSTTQPTNPPSLAPTTAFPTPATLLPSQRREQFTFLTRPPTTPPPTFPPTNAPFLIFNFPTQRPTDAPTFAPTNAPTKPPTRAPTKPPTRAPTKLPTRAPTKPPTRAPTKPPTRAPTKPPTRDPTKEPTGAPTPQPSNLIVQTAQAAPTRVPTLAPSFPIFVRQPTSRPTVEPSRRASRKTSRPTVNPSGIPTVTPTSIPTVTPTEPVPEVLVERLVLPINFTADVILPVSDDASSDTTDNNDASVAASVNVFAARVAGIWERYLGAVLQEQAGLEDFVSWIGIDLTVVPGPIPTVSTDTVVSSSAAAVVANADNTDGTSTRRLTRQLRRRQRRRLQDNAADGGNATAGNATDPSSIRLTTSGIAAFLIESEQVNQEEFLTRMRQVLADALTLDKLQAALTNGGNGAMVSGVAIAANEADENSSASDKPSLADIIIGFTIVAIAVGTLVFWGVVLNRKRKKKLKKRARMTAMSQQKARMGTNMSMGVPMSTPPRLPMQPMPITLAATSPDGSNSSYKGVGSQEEEDAVSDPFGRELQQAASLDQAAWEDFQRQKEAMNDGQRVFASSPGRSVYETVGVIAPPTSMYRANSGQEEQGVEIDAGGIPRTSSFPYGDEGGDSEMPSNPHGVQRQAITLTADDAVPWTAAGIALNVTGTVKRKNNGYEGAIEEEEEWNPYKDSSDRSRLAPSYGTASVRSPARQSGVSTVQENKQPVYRNSPTREIASVIRPGYGSSPDREASRPASYGTSPDREELSYRNSPDGDAIGQPFTPALKEEKPSQYSFLYPLVGQDPSPVANDRASPTDSSADSSAAAVRSSPTSWSTFMGLNQASPPPADDSENENPDDVMTAEMLKEVEELTQYVQQYEKKKETRKQKEKERSMRMETESKLRSIPVGQQDVVSGNKNKQDAPPTSPLRTGRQEQSSENHTVPAPSERSEIKPPAHRSEEPQQQQPNSVKNDRGARVSTVASESSQRNSGKVDREVLPTEKGSSKKAVFLPASDFFLPKAKDTKDPDMTLSSNELMYLPVVPGSFESSYGSDYDSEAEDDTSQRLGISRFSVQKPPAPLLSYKVDPEEPTRVDPPVPVPVQPVSKAREQKRAIEQVVRPSTGARQERSLAELPPSTRGQYQPSEPPLAENEADLSDEESLLFVMQGLPNGHVEEKKEATQQVRAMQGSPNGRLQEKKEATQQLGRDDETPKTNGGKLKGKLSSLRGNTAMLDGASPEEATLGSTGSAMAPYDEAKELIPPSQIPRIRTPGRAAGLASSLGTPPRIGTRSKNKGFNNIMNMFESKPKNAVTPPSATWQYNS